MKKRTVIAALITLAVSIGLCGIGLAAGEVKAENINESAAQEQGSEEERFKILSNSVTGEEDSEYGEGVTYDEKTNTLTLDNATVEFTNYYFRGEAVDEKDLTIKVIGKNILKGSYSDWWTQGFVAAFDVPGLSGIVIEGSGAQNSSIEMTGVDVGIVQGYAGTDENGVEKNGDITIKDVALSMDGEGIISQYSNVTIENSNINVDCKKETPAYFGGNTFGICTGRTRTDEAFGGVLNIKNSDIELKNCGSPLAYNKLNLNGCHLYGGIDSALYEIDPDIVNFSINFGTVKRYYYHDSYMKISKSDLGLGEAYYLDDDTDYEEKGYIVLPDLAAAGQKIEVKVVPDEGYCLKQLYVNDEPIQGTSFTMPAQDTLVKATFEKVKSTSADVKVNNIQLSGISKKIAAGKKIKLTATVSPSNASNQNLTWKSSNTKVATVDASGMVTMKKKSGGKVWTGRINDNTGTY